MQRSRPRFAHGTLALCLLALWASGVSGQEVRGRYRVTLNGFTAQRQTYDHFLQIDGKGDEIYFATYVAEIDTTAPDLLRHWVVTSRAMGDRNGYPDRVKMGFNSSLGGIRSGDRHPLPSPQQRVGPIARDSLPMLLWEGELVQGQRAVVISPTVWEWDDNPELYSYWLVSRGAAIQRLLDPDVILSALDNRAYFPFDIGTPGFLVKTNMFADPRDRPIGLELGQPATGVSFVEPRWGAGKGPQGGGNGAGLDLGSVIGQLMANARAIVQAILTKPSGAPGTAVFGKHFNELVNLFEGILKTALGKPAPMPKSKSRVDAKTPLPWSAAASRDVKAALRKRVDSLSKKSPTRMVKPSPLLGLQGSMRSVVRDYSATQVFFFEKTLVLTPQALEAALSQRTKPGIPTGAIDVLYVDHNPLQGRYILHLQVERIP